jgi:hypothetical protein
MSKIYEIMGRYDVVPISATGRGDGRAAVADKGGFKRDLCEALLDELCDKIADIRFVKKKFIERRELIVGIEAFFGQESRSEK